MLTTTREQEIRWLGLRFAVPGEWQVVRHSLTPHRGGLVLVDRYRQRMQLNWTTLPSPPDLDRMIEDYRAKQLEAQPGAELEDLDEGTGWVGVSRTFGASPEAGHSNTDSRLCITRAVRFDSESGRLLECIINTPPEDEDLVEPLLEGIEAVEPIDAVTRLRAFDLDITTPPDWRLARTDIKPADVTLGFHHVDAQGRETRQALTVRRMGMADTWWHGDAERFIRRSSPGVRFDLDERTCGGRRVARGVGGEAGPRLKRLLGMLRRREDLVWHEGRANAVFHVVLESWPKRDVTPELFGIEDASEWAHG